MAGFQFAESKKGYMLCVVCEIAAAPAARLSGVTSDSDRGLVQWPTFTEAHVQQRQRSSVSVNFQKQLFLTPHYRPGLVVCSGWLKPCIRTLELRTLEVEQYR